jgi:putative addiction module component (TIGR02574 family)
MTSNTRRLLAEALALPEDERLELTCELLASVDGPPEPDWDGAWAAEIDRRVESTARTGERGVPWSDARKQVLSRLERK